MTAESFVALVLLARARQHGRSLVRRAVHLAIAFAVLSWANVLGLYVQRGFFEVAGVTYGFAAALLSVWCETLVRIIVYPLFAHAPASERRFVERVTIAGCAVLAVVWTTSMWASAALSRWPDQFFNTAIVVNMLSCSCAACGFAAAFFVVSSRTIALMRRALATKQAYAHDSHPDALVDALARLEAARRNLLFVGLNVLASSAPFAIAEIVLGSAPYAWVVFGIATLSNGVLITGVTLRLGSSLATPSSRTKSSGPLRGNANKVTDQDAGTARASQQLRAAPAPYSPNDSTSSSKGATAAIAASPSS